jgi:hypothetical protein
MLYDLVFLNLCQLNFLYVHMAGTNLVVTLIYQLKT